MLSLTDMWKASGSPDARRPNDWLALASTIEFRGAVEASFNAGKTGIIGERGRGKGTWAHWQIAMAYAKYLDHDFHMWCNEVVRARMGCPSGTSLISLMKVMPAAVGIAVARLVRSPPAKGFVMPTRSQDPAEYSTLAERCAVAIADAHWFRNMATRALRDGKPRGPIRAERARTAARIILMRAKQDAAMHRMIVEAAAAGRQPT